MMETLLNALMSDENVLLAAIYLALGGAYLLVIPLALFFYLQNRWNVAGSIERLLLYFLVFMFFPGLIVLSLFLNFRPKPRKVPQT